MLQDGRLTLEANRCWVVDSGAFGRALRRASRAVEDKDGGVARGHLEEALALYQGPFLAGVFEPPEILSAREDDPVRPVRAALEVHALLRRISAEVEARLGQPLRMRTGINTGLKGSGAGMPDLNMRSKGTA